MPAALYSQTIKNLVQGVSQQPSFIRYPEQLEEQVLALAMKLKHPQLTEMGKGNRHG